MIVCRKLRSNDTFSIRIISSFRFSKQPPSQYAFSHRFCVLFQLTRFFFSYLFSYVVTTLLRNVFIAVHIDFFKEITFHWHWFVFSRSSTTNDIVVHLYRIKSLLELEITEHRIVPLFSFKFNFPLTLHRKRKTNIII